jgi:hypothetical protein
MLRRSFLLWAGASGLAAAGSGLAFLRWQEITPTCITSAATKATSCATAALPPPSQVIHTDVAILGSGVPASRPHGS